ncbi:hypothetical protein A2U01_0053554, partial [Trifolium medium]|nr:hypothetical protein [Trifolium medium]
MAKNCFEFAKGCNGCQRHASIHRVPANELHTIVKPWPFRGWALELIGQIYPPSSQGHKFILVAIDYFSKWVEAIPLREAKQSDVIKFINDHIVCRFGIPQTLTTDNGSAFVGRKM